jgi:hypothetical protein
MPRTRILALVGLLAATVTLTTVHTSAARAAPPAPARSTAADRARSVLPDSQFCRKILNYSSRRLLDADLNTIDRNGTKVQTWDDLGIGQWNQYWELI